MKRYLYLVILFFTAVLTSCGTKDVKTIIAETKEASFIIYTYNEYGSPRGSESVFFIDANGTGITNYHIFRWSSKS